MLSENQNENEQDLQPTLRITSSTPFILISVHLTFLISLYFFKLSKEYVYGYKIAPVNRHWSYLYFFRKKLRANFKGKSPRRQDGNTLGISFYTFQRALISALSSVEDSWWWSVRVYFFINFWTRNGRNVCINNCQLKKLKIFNQRAYNLPFWETYYILLKASVSMIKWKVKAAIY